MKSSNKTKQKTPPWENPIFLTIMTFVGGYMNGYTYITRNNILANMHTANTVSYTHLTLPTTERV